MFTRTSFLVYAALLVSFLGVTLALRSSAGRASSMPKPAMDEAVARAGGQETAVFAGGCFWGVQAVFQHVDGVLRATSGYAGGSASAPDYEAVSSGATGHAESVQVVYDPAKITYGRLLQVFFSVAHNPTELNRQGPDEGTQYRSAIFYANDEQKRVAEAYIAQLNQAKVFSGPIVTQVAPLQAFYPAEGYHQNYATLHPNNPYIVFNDLPKLKRLQSEYPNLYCTKGAAY